MLYLVQALQYDKLLGSYLPCCFIPVLIEIVELFETEVIFCNIVME